MISVSIIIQKAKKVETIPKTNVYYYNLLMHTIYAYEIFIFIRNKLILIKQNQNFY